MHINRPELLTRYGQHTQNFLARFVIMVTVTYTDFELIEYPPYSPDLALIDPLKELYGKRNCAVNL